jgi:hypothetical protein
MNQKLINCKTCKLRTGCIKPCAALTQYLNKSFPNSGKELNIGVPVYVKDAQVWDMVPKVFKHPTTREKAMLTLDIAGFPRLQICKLFGIKGDSLRKFLYRARKKLQQ